LRILYPGLPKFRPYGVVLFVQLGALLELFEQAQQVH
jgi:hypothetical protein